MREGLDETESRFLERLGNDDANSGVQWGCWCEYPERPSPVATLCHPAVTILFVQKGGTYYHLTTLLIKHLYCPDGVGVIPKELSVRSNRHLHETVVVSNTGQHAVNTHLEMTKCKHKWAVAEIPAPDELTFGASLAVHYVRGGDLE